MSYLEALFSNVDVSAKRISEPGSSTDSQIQNCTVISAYYNEQSGTPLCNGEDQTDYDCIFDGEISMFPSSADIRTENPRPEISSLPFHDDSATETSGGWKRKLNSVQSGREYHEAHLGQRAVETAQPRKKRRLSAVKSASRYSRGLDDYLTLEEARCQNFGLSFSQTNIDSAIGKSKLQLSENNLIILKILYFKIGSPESIVVLKDILEMQRIAPSNKGVEEEFKLSLGNRVRAIERIDSDIAYLGLRKRCHIYQLYLDCSTDSRRTSDSFVVDTTQSISKQKRGQIGNPHNLESARIMDNILKEVYHDLKPRSEAYEKKKSFVHDLWKLGERLDLLVRTFGYGILGLLSWAETNSVEAPDLSIDESR